MPLACGAVAVGASGCSSTEAESARIGREGQRQGAAPAALRLGASNRGVRVSEVSLLSSAGRTAVAARLISSSSHDQRDLPLSLSVTGSAGKVLYSNTAGGLEASLQHLALLPAHQSAWWVDDQVLTSAPARAAKLRVGTGVAASAHAHPTGAPRLSATAGVVSSQAGLSVLSARVSNRSSTGAGNVAVFAVALKAGRVVAAGRAVVAALAAHGHAAVQVFLVGDPAGAKFELDAAAAAA